MTETTQYLTGLGVSLLISIATILYLRPRLRAILEELCGSERRAAFWMAFSDVALCLFPLLFAISRWPEEHEAGPLVRELSTQIGAALGGLLTGVIALGVVVAVFIKNVKIAQRNEAGSAMQ